MEVYELREELAAGVGRLMAAELPIVLFTGSRNWPHYLQVVDVARHLQALLGPYTVMHGAARGLDTFAGIAARALDLPERAIPANWSLYGKAAGGIRNADMLKRRPVLVVAFWNGRSPGTLDCMSRAVNVFRIPLLLYRK